MTDSFSLTCFALNMHGICHLPAHLYQVSGQCPKTLMLVRLGMCCADKLHPVLLDPQNKLTELIVRESHYGVYHNGVKETLMLFDRRTRVMRGTRFLLSKRLPPLNTFIVVLFSFLCNLFV